MDNFERCSECGLLTEEGRKKSVKAARERPIFGTDLNRPRSEIVEDARAVLVRARGIIQDITSGYPAWKDRLGDVEGLINCGLTTLYAVKKEMEAIERRET